MKLGLVTCKNQPFLTEIDRTLLPIFQDKEVNAAPVIWNDPSIQWSNFDYLILRSVWDYHLHSLDFLQWLNHLDELEIPLLNPTDIVRQNHHKFYLKDLQDAGVNIVPTLFMEKSNQFKLNNAYPANWKKAVIKPAISASSYLTNIFEYNEKVIIEDQYRDVARRRDLLVQEFMPEVQTFGELSILFFNRKYSHTVLKMAKPKEFRVQEEFGGITRRYIPTKGIIDQASHILSNFDGEIFQARVDGIIRKDQFILMEIELIEPHLFFEYCEPSINMFVEEVIALFE